MDGLMMDYQLNVPAILRRAEQIFGDVADRVAAARSQPAPHHERRRSRPAPAGSASRSPRSGSWRATASRR